MDWLLLDICNILEELSDDDEKVLEVAEAICERVRHPETMVHIIEEGNI